jgi:hypothetical protein
MKTFELRSVLWGVNIGGSLLILLIITGGITLFGNDAVHWLHVLYIGGCATLLMAAINVILFSSWVIPPLDEPCEIYGDCQGKCRISGNIAPNGGQSVLGP